MFSKKVSELPQFSQRKTFNSSQDMTTSSFFINILAFILCSANANPIEKKRGREKCAIVSVNSSPIKTIFALLTEQIAIQMRFLKLHVNETSFDKMLIGFYSYQNNKSLCLACSLILDAVM